MSGEADVSRGQADVLSMSNHAETAVLGHRDSGGMYLGVGDANRPANAPDSIRTARKKEKSPDLPS